MKLAADVAMNSKYRLAIAVACVGLSWSTVAEVVAPAWLYPVNPPVASVSTSDDAKTLRLATSKASFTQAQLSDMRFAPDWYPASHGSMPPVVARGNGTQVLACGFCHSPTGQGRPENASLAGLPADYIIQQVADFKSGARRSASHLAYLPTALMITQSANTSPEDVSAAAQYFAAQVLRPRVRVVERARIPATHIAGWVYVANAGAHQEPIAGRLLELAPDITRHEKRDDHMRYLAYVPVGSLARGELLARSGVPGVTHGCVSCHSVDLLGAGLAPPIAGRSPTYLLRQLVALQNGTRTGARATLMKTIVADMGLDDMVAVAAFAASLPPARH